MSPKFPEIVYGKCAVCGGPQEYTDTTLTTLQDASGEPLEFYPALGLYLCPLCVKLKESEQQSLDASELHNEEKEFRANAGIKTTIDEVGEEL